MLKACCISHFQAKLKPASSEANTIILKNNGEKLKDLSLIIPTFNRPEFIERLLLYYQKKAVIPHIIVLDSSKDEILNRNAGIISDIGAGFQHVRFEVDTRLADKLAQGITNVETTYCAFCADDDLVFVEGLNAALSYLQTHPDHVCVDGIYLNYNQSENDIEYKIEYSSTGIKGEHSRARVFRLFQNYESLFYGVFRTAELSMIFSAACKIPSLHYQELFQATSALILGKNHRLPIFYAARQHCAPAQPNREKWQTYYWFADDRIEFLEHYQNYRETLWEFYQKNNGNADLSKEDFNQSMDLAHAVFFGTGCPPEYFFSILQNQWPNEAYKEFNIKTDDVSNKLKSKWRRRWEQCIEYIVRKIDKKRLYSRPSKLRALNCQTQKVCKTSWNCLLETDLAWIACSPRFKQAHIELCHYLDGL